MGKKKNAQKRIFYEYCMYSFLHVQRRLLHISDAFSLVLQCRKKEKPEKTMELEGVSMFVCVCARTYSMCVEK